MKAIHRPGRRLVFLALALIAASDAFGQQRAQTPVSDFLPYVSETVEYNSNVFALPNSAAGIAQNNDPKLSDEEFKTAAGFVAGYNVDRQQFRLELEGRHMDFLHFKDLDHYEYTGLAGLNWHLFNDLSGLLQISQQKVMAPFAVRETTTQLALDVDRQIQANVAYQIVQAWRVEGGVEFHNEKAPILGFPDYTLRETIGHAAVKYDGFSYFTYGLTASYAHGSYENAPLNNASYLERDYGFTMSYRASALSSFDFAIGHTQRDLNDDQGKISALTGKLGYTRSTGKTTFGIDLERQANSYLGDGGSELVTLGNIHVMYQATYKTGFYFSIEDKKEQFVGQTLAQTFSVGREDKTPSALARMNWQVTRWVLLSPYASYVKRNSNYQLYEYTGTIAGIEFMVKRPAKAPNSRY